MKKSILSPEFKYVPAAKTNIAKTFARERARLKAEAEERAQDHSLRGHVIQQLKRAGGGK